MIHRIMTAAALSMAVLISTPAQAQKVYQVIIDNSGALRNPDDALKFGAGFLNDLADKLTGSAGRNALAHVVTTHNPRTIYEGNAKGLRAALDQYGAEVIRPVKDGCNQLDEAIDRTRSFAARYNVTEVETYVFSSLIWTPSPCANYRIKLPQPVPQQIDVRSLLLPQTTVLKFFWVDRQQETVWADHIEGNGMLGRIREQEVDYAIRGELATRNFVQQRRIRE